MLSLRVLLVLVVVSLLAACGGSGGNPANGTSWQYTALGDSLAFGVLAQQGYVLRYADYVRTDTGATVSTRNLGVPGWHSDDLLNAIRNDTAMRATVSSAQVVTWDIGGNDIANARSHFVEGTCGGADNQDCLRAAVANFMTNWDGIVTEILRLRSSQQTILRTMDVYNPFINLDVPAGRFAILEAYLDQMNAHIQASGNTNGIPVAAVHVAFNGTNGTGDPVAAGLIAIDNFHPNDAGHTVIADQLRALRYAPLR